MTILALHLSPRKNGNSEIMLDEFLRGVRQASSSEVIKFSVADHNIEPCTGCSICEKTGQCVIKDDDMKQLYPLLASAPKIVVSTSIFFYDVPGKGKNLIDRTQPLWSHRYTLGRTATLRPNGQGFLLALGATKGKDLFIPVELSIKYFFDSIGFPKTFEKLFFPQIEGLKNMAEHPSHLEQLYQAGLNFGGASSNLS